MTRTTTLGALGLIVSMAALAGSCQSSTQPTPEPQDAGPGDSGPAVPTNCGASCQTDLTAARAALVTNDYQRAYALYQCADTPEAAFGAGLTRMILAMEGNNADAVMADFGQAPFSAKDLVGPDSILSRAQARWQGQGSVTLTGDVNRALTLDRALQEIPDPSTNPYGYISFEAEDTTETRGRLSIDFQPPGSGVPALVDGAVLAVSFDCASTYPTRTMDPRLSWVNVSFSPPGGGYSCSLPYSLSTAQCQTDGGSILVNTAATTVGAQGSYTLQNVLLACTPQSGDGSISAPTSRTADTTTPPQTLVRATGTVTARAVSQDLDTRGMHPIFSGDASLNIPADRKVTDLIRHAGAVAEELAEAGCFLERASQGSGTIFTLPGALHGGKDLPVSKGDTQVLASFAYLGAAAGHLATAYEVDMPLGRLICDSSSTGGAPPACPSDQEMTSTFNAAFASAFHGEEFAAVQSLATVALPLLDAGIGNLDASSVLVNNGVSAQGLTLMRDFVQAVRQSLGARVTLPHITPAPWLDLAAFFAKPKNPRDLNLPVLLYQQTCDTYSCWSSVDLNATFFNQYLAESVGVDWSNDGYQWSDDQAVSDTFDEIGRHLEPYFTGKN